MNNNTNSTKRLPINTQLYKDIQAMGELRLRGRPSVFLSELFDSPSLGQDCAADVETGLAQRMVRLFKRHDLTEAQAKSVLDKVRLLVDTGEMGLFNTSTDGGFVTMKDIPAPKDSGNS